MPTTVASVFAAANLTSDGVVRWGRPAGDIGGGVYVVALTEELESLADSLVSAPISMTAVQELLAARPELTLDDQRPSPAELARRLGAFGFRTR